MADRRKTRTSSKEDTETTGKTSDAADTPTEQNNTPSGSQQEASTEPDEEQTESATPSGVKERQDRFKALQSRAKHAAKRNLKETAAESHRLSTDPNALSSVSRKHAFASHNLLKADTEAAGDDFERKRAWDWTIDESEKWDKRMEKKQKHRDNVAFQDYRQDANNVYKRQLHRMEPDLESYEKQKATAVMRAAANGGLEIVENESGELVAVDKNGTFYSTADSTDFVDNRPDRAAVDRLVTDLRKGEETRLKKRRERGLQEEETDVTYISDKNKMFNHKLAHFYNKYTAEIRDSFERGTMI